MFRPLQLLLSFAVFVHADFLRSTTGTVADQVHPTATVISTSGVRRAARHRLRTQAFVSDRSSTPQASFLAVQSLREAVAGRLAAVGGAKATTVQRRADNATASERVLPTTCPSGMPPHDPFWAQESTGYELDSHRDTAHCRPVSCTKNPTNGQRLATLRSLARATDVLLRTHDIDYTLTSGSLIGVERCADVVPWDGDVDVQILDSDRQKLEALFEQQETQAERERSLDFMGFPTFVLLGYPTYGPQGNCFPWRIVDTVTGYYVDIFGPVLMQDVSIRPIHTGKVLCEPSWIYSSWPGPPKRCPWRTCDATPTRVIWPSKRCRFADFYMNCPADNVAYLNHIYGSPVDKPDVPTRDEP